MPASNAEKVGDCVVTPHDARDRFLTALGGCSEAPPRISYIAAFGDLKGTLKSWRAGQHDPSVPSITYSTMFFELCDRLGAEAQIIMRGYRGEGEQETLDGSFRFSRTEIIAPKTYFEFLSGMAMNAWQCVREVKRFQPDIVIVDGFFFWPFFRLLKSRKTKVVLTLHSTCWAKGARKLPLKVRFENILRRIGLRAIDAAVCTSHEAARQLGEIASRKDLPIFVEAPQQVARPSGANVDPYKAPQPGFVYLGRIERDKGVFDLLDAFAAVRVRRPDAELTIAGRGSAVAELKTLVAQEFPDGGVSYLGHLDAAAVHAFLDGAYCLVVPSQATLTEGLAFVCFEAAVHGVPSINSSVVPASELLDGGCVVYQAGSKTALSDAMTNLLEHPEERDRMAELAREKAEIVFDRHRSWGTQLYAAIMRALA